MNKIIIIFIVLILLFGVIFWQSNIEEKDIVNTKSIVDDTITVVEKKSSNLKVEVKATANNHIKLEELKQPFLFHDEPVIDFKFAMSKLGNCIEYFNPILLKGPFANQKKELTEKQSSVISDFNKYCESIKEEYPYYFSTNSIAELIKLNPNLKSITDINNLTETEMMKLTYDFQEMVENLPEPDLSVFNSENAYAVIGAHQLLKTTFEDKVFPDLKEIIGGNDSAYLTKIVTYSENKLACRLGAECGGNSNMMVNYCRIDENNCGLSFMQMYDTRLSRGQQLDIEATEAYLFNFFGFLIL
ncbi:MAG: hypothetical protein AB8B80_06790 [Marinicellaceae bacterium]